MVDNPDLLLETDGAGRANWRFGGAAADPSPLPEADREAGEGSSAGGLALKPRIRRLHLNGIRFAYLDGKSGARTGLRSQKLHIGPREESLAIDFTGRLDETPLGVSGVFDDGAFAVENRARQLEVREALRDTGWQVTPVIDRDYFWAIYFRTPGGVLFEVATNEPGFDRDEDTAHLGEALKLPAQHAHLRAALEKYLEPIEG